MWVDSNHRFLVPETSGLDQLSHTPILNVYHNIQNSFSLNLSMNTASLWRWSGTRDSNPHYVLYPKQAAYQLAKPPKGNSIKMFLLEKKSYVYRNGDRHNPLRSAGIDGNRRRDIARVLFAVMLVMLRMWLPSVLFIHGMRTDVNIFKNIFQKSFCLTKVFVAIYSGSVYSFEVSEDFGRTDK